MPAPKSHVSKLIDAANEAMEARSWDTLRFHAKLIVLNEPERGSSWSYLGIANYHLGLEQNREAQVLEGLAQLHKATELSPNSPMVWANHALALLRQADFEAAHTAAGRATELAPLEITAHGLRMAAEINLQDYAAAEHSFREIAKRVKLDADTAVAMSLLVVPHARGRRMLRLNLVVGIRFDGSTFEIEEYDFDIFGHGATLGEALIDLGTEFETLIEEYVETDDPLDEGAQALAAELRSLL